LVQIIVIQKENIASNSTKTHPLLFLPLELLNFLQALRLGECFLADKLLGRKASEKDITDRHFISIANKKIKQVEIWSTIYLANIIFKRN